ncbi:MAG: DUF1365 domain-containing protein [Rhizomicrobium sp.]
MSIASAIYIGYVTHTRVSPTRHAFRYRVFSLLLDMDEIDALASRSWVFTHNRAGIISFQDTDHGDGRPLRDWLNATLKDAGIEADGPIRVLCYPRLLGLVFNPLSVWFCHRKTGALAAVVYEVHNTHGERHSYVLPVEDRDGVVDHGCAKDFYVSPFLSMDCDYAFRIEPPGETVCIAIRESEHGTPVLNATFSGKRQLFGERNLVLALLRRPLMIVKIVGAIHFEALRLWLKRVPYHAHPTAEI